MIELEKYQVFHKASISDSFKIMDLNHKKIVTIINDDGNCIGLISDGDLRRSIWDDVELSQPVTVIMNKNFVYCTEDDDHESIVRKFSDSKIHTIPLLKDGKLINLLFREDVKSIIAEKRVIDMPVVIMAGGKGTRLDPFTRILPKPLIPVGDHPITRVIMDKFGEYGVREFYLLLNDKARMVKGYFYDHDLPYNINFVLETKPLGTAGGLKYLSGKIQKPFFVSNCDIIINSDYSSMVDFHVNGGYDMTVIGSMRHYVIPYGVCELGDSGELKGMCEKPEQDFLVNTGLYILNPSVLKFIPDDEYYDMNKLINKLHTNKLHVGVYPISEKSWLDIGQWAEYSKTIKEFELGDNYL